MSRHLKLIAAVAVVLVAISGFSPARKGGGRSSSKGGGCSSSSSSSHNNSGSSSSSGSSYGYDDDSDHGKRYGDSSRRGSRYTGTTGTTGTTGSTGSTGSSGSRHSSSGNKAATGTIERCAARDGSGAKAVVSVRNSGGRTKTYEVKVNFRDAANALVDSGSARGTVRGDGSDRVDVRMKHPDRIGDVVKCEVESVR